MNGPTTTEAPPAHVQVVQMALGHWISGILSVAVQLDLAGRLKDGPRSAEELAGPTGTHAPSLHRLMRTLASLGILKDEGGGRYGLTPLGEALADDAPGKARAAILTLASDWAIDGYRQLLYSVQTGRSGYEKSLGMPIFDYLAQHPDKASLFSDTMIGFHGMEPAAIADAYDFSGMGTLADVGGASGFLIATMLERNPKLRGILFDLPHVVKDAKALLAARGVADRVTIEAGSFFERVPEGADGYLLSHIIHDWSEAQCLAILANVKRAMKPGAKLLLVEMVLPPGDAPHPGKLLDMMMLVGPGGQERTEAEYAALLAKAGFKLTRLVPTASAVSVVEAVPA